MQFLGQFLNLLPAEQHVKMCSLVPLLLLTANQWFVFGNTMFRWDHPYYTVKPPNLPPYPSNQGKIVVAHSQEQVGSRHLTRSSFTMWLFVFYLDLMSEKNKEGNLVFTEVLTSLMSNRGRCDETFFCSRWKCVYKVVRLGVKTCADP